ncbi:ankyrin repeat domain-containing protein 23-like [Macrosteles quadrilineatus]|uniref:ankyrin repeat domain-containing protein 23-like n=1 Tax=Macrosteles quadrilineatus TaxID=74068 RepID=UPI0023E0DE69|nr:ankyrin repeat domain-containing protein 23-like [Macrosteles quadrilineatus]
MIHIFSKKVLSVVAKLVQLGAELEARDTLGNTPMHYSVVCGSLEVLKYLHHEGSVATTNFRQQPLMHFVLEKLERADLNAQNNKGQTALHVAVKKLLRLVLKLVCKGADVNINPIRVV